MKKDIKIAKYITVAMKAVLITAIVLVMLIAVPGRASAEESFVEVIGNVYEFDKKSNYEITDEAEYVQSRHDNTYGKFSVQAELIGIKEQDGMMNAGVQGETVGFYYSYGDGALYEDTKSGDWVLTKDNGKKIDGMKMDGKIGKGTIIIQSSEDGETWQTVFAQTDAFQETPYRAHPIYTTNIQRYPKGCYFRVIVVYKEQRLAQTKRILFFDIDKNEYRKKAEVYEFHLYEVDIDLALVNDIGEQAASGANVIEEGITDANEQADAAADAASSHGSTLGWKIAMIAIVVIAIIVIAFIVVKRIKWNKSERK